MCVCVCVCVCVCIRACVYVLVCAYVFIRTKLTNAIQCTLNFELSVNPVMLIDLEPSPLVLDSWKESERSMTAKRKK